MKNFVTDLFGLFELDTSGTVLYSKIDALDSIGGWRSDLVGRNFFDEFAADENTAELRRRFRYFAKGSDSADKFTFTYLSEQKLVEVKVMLTQISEREFNQKEKLIILDIRKIH